MSIKRQARYEAIAADLRKLIASGAPGDRLPSDAELCERYGVSRMTARQAVQLVATDGLIDRRDIALDEGMEHLIALSRRSGALGGPRTRGRADPKP